MSQTCALRSGSARAARYGHRTGAVLPRPCGVGAAAAALLERAALFTPERLYLARGVRVQGLKVAALARSGAAFTPGFRAALRASACRHARCCCCWKTDWEWLSIAIPETGLPTHLSIYLSTQRHKTPAYTPAHIHLLYTLIRKITAAHTRGKCTPWSCGKIPTRFQCPSTIDTRLPVSMRPCE